jgi:2-C-methyl-D-erythritol 4-phosphate cytidylyltransferase
MQDHLIIVAGGSGKRMGTELPKQFLELNGKPILVHTIERFHNFNNQLNIIVVMNEEYIDYWGDLCRTIGLSIPHQVVKGGKERFFSVLHGLNKIPDSEGIVGVHDAVRPLVSKRTFVTCYESARINGTAVPVLPVNDSLRFVADGKNEIADRSKFRLVQTPQCFEISLLKKAFQQGYNPSFTDDASVVEFLGVAINLVEGNRENIKITTPEDLRFCSANLTFDYGI